MPSGLSERGISPWWPVKVITSLIAVLWGALAGPELLSAGPRLSIPLFIGQAILVFGALTHLGHYVVLKRRISALGNPNELVTTGGLFATIRHPMYLGDCVMVLGATLMAADVLGLLILAVFAGSVVPLCIDEDKMMSQKFGNAFEVWSGSSSRLIPFLW